MKYNFKWQKYRNFELKLVEQTDEKFSKSKDKRFIIKGLPNRISIPNKYLEEDGSLKSNSNIDYLFDKAKLDYSVPEKYNTNIQMYKNIPLELIVYTESHFARLNAKRFTVNKTNQNVWIPNYYLEENGTIKIGLDMDFIFYKSRRQLEIAGIQFQP